MPSKKKNDSKKNGSKTTDVAKEATVVTAVTEQPKVEAEHPESCPNCHKNEWTTIIPKQQYRCLNCDYVFTAEE